MPACADWKRAASACPLTADGLFRGQSQAFFDTITGLAEQADAAQRGF